MRNSDSCWVFHWIALQWNSILGFGFGYNDGTFKSFTSETLCTSRGVQSVRNDRKQGAGNRTLALVVSMFGSVWRVTSDANEEEQFCELMRAKSSIRRMRSKGFWQRQLAKVKTTVKVVFSGVGYADRQDSERVLEPPPLMLFRLISVIHLLDSSLRATNRVMTGIIYC